MPDSTMEVVIVGGGPAGLTAAIALATAGVETVLVAKAPAGVDHRTTMLLTGSATALEMLGVCSSRMRLPMVPASESERAVIKQALTDRELLSATAPAGGYA